MAEDLLIGFKFNDREDNFARDKAVLETAQLLFVEAGFDASKDHLGDFGADAFELKLAEFDDGAVADYSFSNGFESGDF